MTIDPFTTTGHRDGTPHTRPEGKECPGCDSLKVVYTLTNTQYVAHCEGCGQSRGNLPKAELGLGPERIRRGSWTVGPEQARDIRIRDRGVCAMCRTTEGPLEVGHLISVRDAKKLSPSLEPALRSDANLALMCRECNADLSSRSVSLLWMAALHMEQERS